MRRLIPPSSDCSYEPAIGRLFQPALSALLLSAFQSPRLYRKLHQQPLQPTCSKWQDNILQGRHRCIPDFENCRCYKYRNIECLFPLIQDDALEKGPCMQTSGIWIWSQGGIHLAEQKTANRQEAAGLALLRVQEYSRQHFKSS